MIGLLLAAVIIVLNGFFVAAEFALVKMHATQLHSRVGRGEKRAILAQSIIARLDRYLSVTQVGITLASLALGWIGEPAIERLIVSLVDDWVPEEHARMLHVAAVVVALSIITFGHLLFGELVPKLIGIQKSEATALFSAVPLKIMHVVFLPVLWVLDACSGLILRLMGLSSDAANEGTLSEDQILGILAANTARSPGGKEKGMLVERVVRFSQRTARHAMIPRVDVASLPIDTPRTEAIRFIRNQQYSRLILTKDRSLDNVVGYLYVKDFLLEDGMGPGDLRNLRRDAIFVPETQSLLEVLRRMQETQIPFAVVVDEYGGTSGIVTMEDLLEEIVGEIRDELDVEPATLVKVPDEEHAWEADARLKMDDLRSIGVHVENENAAEPIGAVLLEKLGRLPRKGDSVNIAGNAVGIVSALSRRRIIRVRIRITPQPAAA